MVCCSVSSNGVPHHPRYSYSAILQHLPLCRGCRFSSAAHSARNSLKCAPEIHSKQVKLIIANCISSYHYFHYFYS